MRFTVNGAPGFEGTTARIRERQKAGDFAGMAAQVSDDPLHLQACHLDETTKDREAAKVIAGTLAEVS